MAYSRPATDRRPRYTRPLASVLQVLAGRDTVPGVIRGRAVRLLLDEGELAQDEAARLMGLVLSPGTEPGDAAAWIEGFVGGGSGGGMLLVHDERLLGLVDAWLTGVAGGGVHRCAAAAAADVLGVRGGRAQDAGRARPAWAGSTGAHAAATSGIPGFAPNLDRERADAVLPVLSLLLGLDESDDGTSEDSAADDNNADDNNADDNNLVEVAR